MSEEFDARSQTKIVRDAHGIARIAVRAEEQLAGIIRGDVKNVITGNRRNEVPGQTRAEIIEDVDGGFGRGLYVNRRGCEIVESRTAQHAGDSCAGDAGIKFSTQLAGLLAESRERNGNRGDYVATDRGIANVADG